jgi:glutaredoxin
MSIVVYVSSSAGVRKTMDNCKFITDTFDILKIKYTTVDLAITPEKRPDMEKNSGKKVVPQVFINDKYIGVRLSYQILTDKGF